MKSNKIQVILLILYVFVNFSGISEQAYASSTMQTTNDSKVFLPIIHKSYPIPLPGEPGYCNTTEEIKLASMINEYRRMYGLPDAPLSRSLSTVAQWHVRDLQWNSPNSGKDPRGLPCNLHSWSNKGFWTPVCYTSDHYYASGMWQKPQEVTLGVYTDYGFEIAVGANGWNATAQGAFNSWKNSPGHNDVIIEQGPWTGYNWPAMGVAIYQGYAVTWFSRTTDPVGTIPACEK